MAKDHYIPAAWLGRFSAEVTLPARRRIVHVARTTKVFSARAEDVGFVRDLYSLQDPPSSAGATPKLRSMDRTVSGYEAALPQALDQLEQSSPVPLAVWLRTLVPWVTSIFVRGADFTKRFNDRMGADELPELWVDNANMARAFELQRLLAPVMLARWIVMHSTAKEPIVINDLGLTTTRDPMTEEWGWAIPLSSATVLVILPKARRPVARYSKDSWFAVLEHGPLGDSEVRTLNEALAKAASDFIVSADPDSATRLQRLLGEHGDPARLMKLWPFDGRTLREHQFEWNRLVSATTGDPVPEDVGDLDRIAVDALSDADWVPTRLLPADEPPTGLRLRGQLITLTMSP